MANKFLAKICQIQSFLTGRQKAIEEAYIHAIYNIYYV